MKLKGEAGEPTAQPVCEACYNYAEFVKKSGSNKKLWREHIRLRQRKCDGERAKMIEMRECKANGLRERVVRTVCTAACREGARAGRIRMEDILNLTFGGNFHPATMGWLDEKTDIEYSEYHQEKLKS